MSGMHVCWSGDLTPFEEHIDAGAVLADAAATPAVEPAPASYDPAVGWPAHGRAFQDSQETRNGGIE